MDMWGTAELIVLQQDRRQAPPDGFWMRFFPTVVTSTAEEIYFDQLPIRDRRLAPFVAPNVQGRVMRDRGRPMGSFKPAYLKPKHVVSPDRAIRRMPGEPLQGNLSPAQRRDRIVAQNMRDEREMIERRWDWMAAHAVIYGYVDVYGEDYPKVRVDFKRDASLTIILGAGATWDDPDVLDPIADINLGRTRAFELGQSPVNTIIFGTLAWAAFSSKEKVQKLLDNQNRGSNSLFNSTGLQSGEPYEYQGRIAGPNGGGFIDLYTYSNTYEDENGEMQDYLDPRDVVGIGGNLQGVRAFGAILDHESMEAVPMFPKMWKNQDPSVIYTMTQSAPLMVPGNPNNSFRIRAVA